jgi:hypothetical protein
MFSENKPDITHETTLDLVTRKRTFRKWDLLTANSDNSATKVKDFSVTEGSVIKYSSEFPADTAKWKITGSWAVAENAISTGDLKDLSYLSPAGLYVQGNPKGSEVPVRLTSGGSLILNDLVFNKCTISAHVMRDSVFNGFNIRFGVVDDKNYYTLAISNPRMRRFFMPGSLSGNQNQPAKYVASIEHVVNGATLRLGTIGSSFDFTMGTWHNIKVSINGKISPALLVIISENLNQVPPEATCRCRLR